MSELEPLSYFEKLESLDLYGCAVTNTPDYQIILFSLIPSLKALDRFDINFKGIRVQDDDDESTQEDFEREKDLPKTKPPPQNGKLFSNNYIREIMDYKVNGTIRLHLDNVISNVKSQTEYSSSSTNHSIPSPPPPPLPSPPTSPITSRLDEQSEANIRGAALKLFQEGAEEESSDDEDFDPNEESAGESSSEEESEGEYSSGGEDDIPNLKRNRTEGLEEDSVKKQKKIIWHIILGHNCVNHASKIFVKWLSAKPVY